MPEWELVIFDTDDDYYVGKGVILLRAGTAVWTGDMADQVERLLRVVLGDALTVTHTDRMYDPPDI